MPPPTVDYASIGQYNQQNTQLLVNQIKLMQAELAGLRNDQVEQAQAYLAAVRATSKAAADTIVEGSEHAAQCIILATTSNKVAPA